MRGSVEREMCSNNERGERKLEAGKVGRGGRTAWQHFEAAAPQALSLEGRREIALLMQGYLCQVLRWKIAPTICSSQGQGPLCGMALGWKAEKGGPELERRTGPWPTHSNRHDVA